MAIAVAPQPEHLTSFVFDLQPTPVIVLSDAHTILLANHACRILFPQHNDFIGKHVSILPLTWQDGSNETLQDLLTNRVHENCDPDVDTDDRWSTTALKLQVDICRGPQSTIASACLLVTDTIVTGQQCRLLSFENVKESHATFVSPADPQARSSSFALPKSKILHSDRAYTGTRGSTMTSQEHLEAKFAQLRDAIYFNEQERSGFLLSADESFCFPNYRGPQDVTPVEIDDIELFFQNWDVWDPHFTRREPLSEYPAIWISRNRVPLKKRRYGLKEDGKRYIIEATGKPLYDHRSGQYIGCVVWVVNAGDYETVQARDLKADLADFRTMCDRLPHLLWTVDAQGRADYFSQSWYDFTGLSEEQSLDLAFEQAIDKEDMQKVWAAFAIAAENKTECLAEAKYRRHDGQWLWMSVRAKPLFDAHGEILKWYGSSTNIDSIMVERLIAERQRTQIMGMLSLADVGLFEVDSDWRLTMLEGRMLWQDELQPDQVLSMAADDLSDTRAKKFKKQLQQVMTGDHEAAVFEELIGARWYKFRLVFGSESDKSGVLHNKVLGCSVDITEQRLRAALASENARLIHEASLETEKSRLKTAFLAHMSHEIRTPIAGIIGTANMLAESCIDEELKDGINDIELLGNNLLTIINDILDFSKIEAGKMELESTSYDMNAIIKQITKVFGHVLRGKPTKIICQHDLSNPLHMTGDPGRTKQILTNLVSNAVKFTPAGSVEIQTHIADGEVKVLVLDTGEGIDEPTMSTLFKPFVQGDASTARRHGGTGLGLTISRDLAEKMGGTLVLSSKPSEGTTAILTLPRVSTLVPLPTRELEINKKEIKVTVREFAPASSPSDSLVLVVEDNAVNQKIALNLVRKLGYRAEAVWNGQEALNYIENRETPSLILMDCQMPLLDGPEATRRLRKDPRYQKSQSVPVIALTASAIQGDREKCYAAGMDAYLCKPVTKQVLQAMLANFLRGDG